MNQIHIKLFARVVLTVVALLAFNADADEIKQGVRHVGATQAQQILESNANIQVLDVRTAKEFAEGHIEGAINIDYYADDFVEQLQSLDPHQQYVVHCRSGGRSGRALPILKSAGMTDLIHLDGGIKAWNSAELPLQQ